MEVSYEDFAKLELKIGKVIQVEDISGSNKLLKLTVDFGNEKRIAVGRNKAAI
jgi:tRNA-binding EMAP/Myf-like protein